MATFSSKIKSERAATYGPNRRRMLDKMFLKLQEASEEEKAEKLREMAIEFRNISQQGKYKAKSAEESLIRSSGDLCYKITGKDNTGKIAWYFVLIDRNKKEKFLRHRPGDSYNIEDYGKIIASGYGEEVPAETQQILREKYNFDNF